ncbi:MAG: biopolymer transporter ExbD [Myxococcota bacterium]|nr:biopolymer transporter ExbD [Myxococcota bacterium]
MGASALPSGEDESDGIVAEINVTPLTDVFLVLLIIFMVTTTVINDESKNIDLPQATESEETPNGVTVAVDDTGMLMVNDRRVAEDDLQAALERALELAEQKIVILRGDKNVLLGQAVGILDMAQQAGAKGIALATKSPD